MQATFGRIALTVLLSTSLCGCKSGSNMFAWNKKSAADGAGEAPKFAAASPALPSAGQAPGATPSNVAGTVAAGMPAYDSVKNPATATAYGNLPASYQQAVYPTTPYPPASLAQNAKPATNTPPTAAGTSSWNSMASGVNATGNTVYNGSPYNSANSNSTAIASNSSPVSPPTAYGNAASTAVQPQQGQYNPAYGAAATTAATLPAYNTAPASSPYASVSTPPTASPASSLPTGTTPPADYRMADARGAMNSSAPSAAAPVAPANNSMVGDRYSNLNTSSGGDRYASATPNIAAASTEMTAAAPANSYDRYGMQPNRYQPDAPVASPTANASNGSPNAANISPTATGGGAALPQRPDPNYRPAGTSSYSPRENMLRPGASEAPIESQPGNRVVPASYEATTGGGAEPNLIGNPSSSAPISQPVAAQSVGVAPKAAEAYGPYQGAASDPQSSKSVQPAGGASSAASTPPGLFQNHSWQ